MNEMEKWLKLMDDLEESVEEARGEPLSDCCDAPLKNYNNDLGICSDCGEHASAIEESYPMGMPPNAPEDRTEIMYNLTKNSGPDAQVTINARAPNMEELKKVLAMAGLDPEGAEKHDIEEPDSVKVVDVSPADSSPCGSSEPLGMSYSTDKEELIDMLKSKLQQKFA